MVGAKQAFAIIACLSPWLVACGLQTPEMQGFGQKQTDEKFYENDLVAQIKCELHKGVLDTLREHRKGGAFENNPIEWLPSWGAKVSLALTVDEKGALAPGLSYNSPIGNALQTVSVVVGAQASSESTRKETIEFSFSFSDLLHEKDVRACDRAKDVTVESDLKIGQFISNKGFIASVPGSVSEQSKASPYSAFNYEVTFVLIYEADITPVWKLVRWTVGPTSTFASAMRTKTQDILITLTETAPSTKTAPARISTEGQILHNAALIGQSIAAALQAQRR